MAMIEGWTCSRCSSANVEASLVCSTCGLTRPDDDFAASIAPAPIGSPTAAGHVAAENAPAKPRWGGELATPAALGGTPASLGATPPSVTGTAAAPDAVPGWVAPDGTQPLGPSAPVPLWRRIPVGWLLVVVFVAGTAIVGWYFSAGRSSSGEITKSGDLIASELRVGDCFDLKDPTADEVEDVTAVPCTAEHEYEVLFVGSFPSGDYPPETTFETYVGNNCRPAFDAYIGKALAESELDIFWFYPTDDAWRSGDRSVQCAAFHPANNRLTESLKGSRQ
jgi:Septum formation